VQDQSPSGSIRKTSEEIEVAGPSIQIMDIPVDTSRECYIPHRSAKNLTFV
jgi:hypothetical protein